MVPATVTCSYAFMLPVATPPNAIVYAAAKMKPTQMVRLYIYFYFRREQQHFVSDAGRRFDELRLCPRYLWLDGHAGRRPFRYQYVSRVGKCFFII